MWFFSYTREEVGIFYQNEVGDYLWILATCQVDNGRLAVMATKVTEEEKVSLASSFVMIDLYLQGNPKSCTWQKRWRTHGQAILKWEVLRESGITFDSPSLLTRLFCLITQDSFKRGSERSRSANRCPLPYLHTFSTPPPELQPSFSGNLMSSLQFLSGHFYSYFVPNVTDGQWEMKQCRWIEIGKIGLFLCFLRVNLNKPI